MIKQVHESGAAILVVEQNANVSLSIADRGYVLSTGRLSSKARPRSCASTRIFARPTSVGSSSAARLVAWTSRSSRPNRARWAQVAVATVVATRAPLRGP